MWAGALARRKIPHGEGPISTPSARSRATGARAGTSRCPSASTGPWLSRGSSEWAMPCRRYIARVLYCSVMAARPKPARQTVADKRPLERLRERIAAGDRGWFFADIADKVAARRLQMRLSQRELAELCGTTQSAIARLERGGRPPRIDPLLRIAEALECELVVDLLPRS